EDLLRDLHAEGFRHPWLFRISAQLWLDRFLGRDGEVVIPDSDQFQDLARWLEMGLTRLEIEAIKAKGVSQLLRQLLQALRSACPPNLFEAAEKTRDEWRRLIAEQANTTAEILINTLEPHQREIEQHFALEGHRRF